MKHNQNDLAALVLRIALGGMFLAHGFTKLLIFTPIGTAHYFESLGFPGFVGYLTIFFEIGGGAFLLLGILTRPIAILTIIQMIVISYIHSSNGWSFSNAGGGWEYPAFMAMTAISLAILGGKKFSILSFLKLNN